MLSYLKALDRIIPGQEYGTNGNLAVLSLGRQVSLTVCGAFPVDKLFQDSMEWMKPRTDGPLSRLVGLITPCAAIGVVTRASVWFDSGQSWFQSGLIEGFQERLYFLSLESLRDRVCQAYCNQTYENVKDTDKEVVGIEHPTDLEFAQAISNFFFALVAGSMFLTIRKVEKRMLMVILLSRGIASLVSYPLLTTKEARIEAIPTIAETCIELILRYFYTQNVHVISAISSVAAQVISGIAVSHLGPSRIHPWLRYLIKLVPPGKGASPPSDPLPDWMQSIGNGLASSPGTPGDGQQ